MSVNKKVANVIFGANCAGKTTFYHNVLSRELEDGKKSSYVNTNDISIALQVEKGLSRVNANSRASFEAIRKIQNAIKNDENIVFEALLSDDSAMGSISIIRELKKNGYETQGHFINTDNPEINIKNMIRRVGKGVGHFIEDKVIEDRYYSIIENVKKHKDELFDNIKAYDNSHNEFIETSLESLLNNSDIRVVKENEVVETFTMDNLKNACNNMMSSNISINGTSLNENLKDTRFESNVSEEIEQNSSRNMSM